jgi:hypothetical protein
MAERIEVAAAKLLVAVAEAKNIAVEPWIEDLSHETPNGVPAYSKEDMVTRKTK